MERIGGWKEWLPVIQDARFLQDAGLLGGRFAYAPGVGARYRVRAASLSRRSVAAFVSDVFRNACDLQRILEAKGGINRDERRHLAYIYNYTARSLFFHDRAAFRECVARLYDVDPTFPAKWPKIASLAANIVGYKAAGALLSLSTKLRRIIGQA